MFQVIPYTQWDQISLLQQTWEELSARSHGQPLFQSFDWYSQACQLMPFEPQPYLLLVCVLGKPIGIVPLVRSRIPGLLGEKQILSYPVHPLKTPWEPIGPNVAATLAGAMKYLRNESRDWDQLEFHSIDVTLSDHGRTQNAFRLAGWKTHPQIASHQQSHLLNMHLNFSGYQDQQHQALAHITSYRSGVDQPSTLEILTSTLAHSRLVSGDAQTWTLLPTLISLADRHQSCNLIIQKHPSGSLIVLLNLLDQKQSIRCSQIYFAGHDKSSLTTAEVIADCYRPAYRMALCQYLIDQAQLNDDEQILIAPAATNYFQPYLSPLSGPVTASFTKYASLSLSGQWTRWKHYLKSFNNSTAPATSASDALPASTVTEISPMLDPINPQLPATLPLHEAAMLEDSVSLPMVDPKTELKSDSSLTVLVANPTQMPVFRIHPASAPAHLDTAIERQLLEFQTVDQVLPANGNHWTRLKIFNEPTQNS